MQSHVMIRNVLSYKESNKGGSVMEFIVGLILGFIGGVVPSLLILIMTNDEKARAECLNSTYELENEFERLSRVLATARRRSFIDCFKELLMLLAP